MFKPSPVPYSFLPRCWPPDTEEATQRGWRVEGGAGEAARAKDRGDRPLIQNPSRNLLTREASSMGTNSMASAPEEIDGFEVFSGDLEQCCTEDLIYFLQCSFQELGYKKVARILTSREKSLKTEIVKKCTRLEEQLTRIKEDLGVIDALLAEIEKKEKERRKEFVELKAANRDLECTKRRAEDERDEWKKKFGDLQVRALRLVEENDGIMNGQKSTEKEKQGKQSEALKAGTPSERFIDITGSSDSDEERSATANTLKSAKKFNSDWRKVDVLDGKRQYKENCLCTSSSKRKHVSEMVAGSRKSKNDDKDGDDNDDKIPIGKLIQGKESR